VYYGISALIAFLLAFYPKNISKNYYARLAKEFHKSNIEISICLIDFKIFPLNSYIFAKHLKF